MPRGTEGDNCRADVVDHILHLICIMVLVFLGATTTICNANAGAVEDALQQQRTQQQRQLEQIRKLTTPLIVCVKKQARAYEIYSSPEKADIAARAAVGLCSKQEAAYRSALFQLAIIITDFDAAARAKQTHDQLVEMALTIIVSERQRQRDQPRSKDKTNTQQFKNGCADFIAGRMTDDAFECVSVLSTALELVAIFQEQGGTKRLNICIPNNPMRPHLVGDYVKLINQYSYLMNDNEPISVGLIKILARAYPCTAP
jgi:hypothetical protein